MFKTTGINVLLILILCLFLTSCASVIMGKVETKITEYPDKNTWVIESKADAVVRIERNKDGTTKVEVDNRGAPSLLSQWLLFWGTRTNVNLGLSNKPQDND